MQGYIVNIEEEALKNSNFRKVLYTDVHVQLVVMSLKPGEEIGEEVHGVDQFIRVEEGEGKAVLNGKAIAISAGFAVVVPQGTKHNIINTSKENELKLYTLYAPPEHRDQTTHKTKKQAEAQEANDHFDGKVTESY